MRRLALGILLLCALAAPAAARVLVVYDQWNDAADGALGLKDMQYRLRQGAVEVMDRFGVDYVLIPASATKTEFCRTGGQVWGFGSPAAYLDRFDAVMHLNWRGSAGSASSGFFPRGLYGYFPCSLTTAPKMPTVAQLFVFGAINPAASATPNNMAKYTDNAVQVCSTGVASFAWSVSANSAFPALGYLSADPSKTWLSASNQGGDGPGSGQDYTNAGPGFLKLNGTPPAGGSRALVGLATGTSASFAREAWTGVPCANCDTLYGTGRDSVVVWERLYNNLRALNAAGVDTACSREVFANVMGASTCTDSLGNNVACEFDAPTFLMALAHLDSLTGGKVFTKQGPAGPVTAAVVIRGGFQRGNQRHPGGIPNSDSLAFKASLDSLRTYNIPVTATVNVDSIATYPNEIAWWRDLLPSARLVGIANAGAGILGRIDTTFSGGNASRNFPVDVFGRYRVRAFKGEGTGQTDSTIFSLLKGCDSIIAYYWGERRISRAVIAPWDDYSPKNMMWTANAADSLAWTLVQAGKNTLVTDVQRAEADPAQRQPNRDLVRGWWPYQGYYQSAIGGAPLKLAGHTGFSISGAKYFADIREDSTTIPHTYSFGGGGPSRPSIGHRGVARAWDGLCHNVWFDQDWQPHDGQSSAWTDIVDPLTDTLYPRRRANVLMFHCSDFGGTTNGPPKRPGWWVVKSVKRQMDAINYFAGRTIVRLGYVEDVTP